MTKKLTKVSFYRFTNVCDHKLFKDVPLPELFEKNHTFNIVESSLLPKSKLTLNDKIEISVSDYSPVLSAGYWRDELKPYNIYVNGWKFWPLAGDSGLVQLHERDIVEITYTDIEKDILVHEIVIVTKIFYEAAK